MHPLSYRQEQIQEKVKNYSFREFLLYVASWQPLNVYKTSIGISRYPESERAWNVVPLASYDPARIAVGAEEWFASFFDSLKDLFQHQEKMGLMHRFQNENCDFAEVYGARNCYLSFSVGANAENVLYSLISWNDITNIYNAFSVYDTSNLYASVMVHGSLNVFYSNNIYSSNNIRFSSNLIWCTECVLCDRLTNVSYCVENKQYEKEEYFLKKQEVLAKKEEYDAYHRQMVTKGLANHVSTNVTWAGIFSSHNIVDGYFVKEVDWGKNLIVAGWAESNSKDLYGCLDVWFEWENSNYYNVHYCGEWSNHIYCSSSAATCSNIYYSYFLENCSYCIGCVWLKNQHYCILNKQYTKEEREEKADQIFQSMSDAWVLGWFLPAKMNPFYFNDTAAYLLDSTFTKEEVVALWYLWRDEPIKIDIPERMEKVNISDLQDYEWYKNGVWTIDTSILKKVILDEQGNSYRVIKVEYDFLMRYGLPLPRKHWLDRMKENFSI